VASGWLLTTLVFWSDVVQEPAHKVKAKYLTAAVLVVVVLIFFVLSLKFGH